MILQLARIQWLEEFETAQELSRDRHHSSPIIEFAAILKLCQFLTPKRLLMDEWTTHIRRREDGDQNPVTEKFISIFHHHMRPTNEIKVMRLQKLHDDFLPKTVAYASLIGFPVRLHISWIAPQKVIEKTIIGYIGWSGDMPYVIHVL